MAGEMPGARLAARVRSLAAWAPGLSSPESWAAWARGDALMQAAAAPPAATAVEPMLRRRLGALARAALGVLDQVVAKGDPVRLVFASRHGELARTVDLLADIADAEPLSPTAFSLSVHNAIPGLYSIAYGDVSASTALAADVESFPWAAIEAMTELVDDAARDVVLLYADEPLPGPYAAFDDAALPPHALAIRFSAREGDFCEWSWEHCDHAAGGSDRPLPSEGGRGEGAPAPARPPEGCASQLPERAMPANSNRPLPSEGGRGEGAPAPARPPEGCASQLPERAMPANSNRPLPSEGGRGEGAPLSAALTFLRFWYGSASQAQWVNGERRWSWRRDALAAA